MICSFLAREAQKKKDKLKNAPLSAFRDEFGVIDFDYLYSVEQRNIVKRFRISESQDFFGSTGLANSATKAFVGLIDIQSRVSSLEDFMIEAGSKGDFRGVEMIKKLWEVEINKLDRLSGDPNLIALQRAGITNFGHEAFNSIRINIADRLHSFYHATLAIARRIIIIKKEERAVIDFLNGRPVDLGGGADIEVARALRDATSQNNFNQTQRVFGVVGPAGISTGLVRAVRRDAGVSGINIGAGRGTGFIGISAGGPSNRGKGGHHATAQSTIRDAMETKSAQAVYEAYANLEITDPHIRRWVEDRSWELVAKDPKWNTIDAAYRSVKHLGLQPWSPPRNIYYLERAYQEYLAEQQEKSLQESLPMYISQFTSLGLSSADITTRLRAGELGVLSRAVSLQPTLSQLNLSSEFIIKALQTPDGERDLNNMLDFNKRLTMVSSGT